jgi:hypothetical protein
MTELRQRQPRVLNPRYLAWLRRQPCACGCGSPAPSDAAHIRTGSVLHGKRSVGMAEKPDDRWALPLKRSHHRAQHDYGNELGWWHAHNIDLLKLSARYYVKFIAECGYDALDRKIENKPRVARKPKRKSKIASRPFQKRVKK